MLEEIKRDSKNGVYEKLLDRDEFIEAFFNIYKS